MVCLCKSIQKPNINFISDHPVALPCCNNNMQLKGNAWTDLNKALKLICVDCGSPEHEN